MEHADREARCREIDRQVRDWVAFTPGLFEGLKGRTGVEPRVARVCAKHGRAATGTSSSAT